MSQEDSYQYNENNIADETSEIPSEPGGEKKKKSAWPWILGIFAVLLIGSVVLLVLSQQAPETAVDESWERVKLAGVLRVATSADYQPFSYFNQDFKIDGFDPALIREIGNRLGIQVEITDFAFEGLNAVLQNDQADVAIAAISVSPEREAVVDFSNIYFIGDDGVLARSDSGLAPITDVNQLAGLAVGVQRGTVYEKWAQETLVGSNLISQDQLFSYVRPEQAVDDLKASLLHVVILDRQPAIKFLSDPDLVLAGERLNQQRLAIALPAGSQALQSVINQALLDLQNEGRINQLVQDYLGLQPEDIIPPPICFDSMTFIRDINLDDEDLTVFPEFNPGEAFQKGWQVKNTGTCTWSEGTFIKFVRGNDPAAQMGGQPTVISGRVEPDETYDLYVNLVAPQQAGKFVGYWQMHNAQGVPFGQTIWVAIQVPGIPPEPTEPTEPQPPTPTLTETEAPPEPTETDLPPEPTETEVPPEPTETEVPPEPTETEAPPEPTEEPGADLLDFTWVLDSYLLEEEDEDLTEAIEDVEVLLVFEESRTVSGNTGCNNFSGRFVTDGTAIIIEDLLYSRIFCEEPEGLMDQEDRFLEWLEQVEEYRIILDEEDHERLEMFITVMEGDREVEKVLLVFFDQEDGPPER
jgi:polar amino acid transport system substrate-binding protein